jgi:CrcB protein
MNLFIAIFLGGGLGAITRYLIIDQINKANPNIFPYGTIVVNILGSLLIGIVYCLLISKITVNENIKVFITIGFLGGFTTFSSFNLDFFKLIESGNILMAISYAITTFITTIIAFYVGYSLSKILI